MKPSSRGAVAWRWTPPAVIAALAVLAGRAVPWSDVAARIGEASLPMLALATAATYVAVAARLVAWWSLLRGVGVSSFALASRATVVGMAINCVLIANVGEVHRVGIVVREARVSASAVIATVVVERLIVSVPFALLLAGSGLMLPLPPELARWGPILLGAVAAMITCLVLLARPGRQEIAGRRLAAGCLRRVANALRPFREAVHVLLSAGRTSLVLGLAVVHWSFQIIALVLLEAALQLPMPLAGTVLALLGMSASGSVRLAPGNLGLNQIVYVGTAATFGLEPESALGVAMVMQMIQTVPLLVLALVMSLWAGFPGPGGKDRKARHLSHFASRISRNSRPARPPVPDPLLRGHPLVHPTYGYPRPTARGPSRAVQ